MDPLKLTEISPTSESLDLLRRLVTECGGQWLGVQSNCLDPNWQLWFKNPTIGHAMWVGFDPTGFLGSELCEKVRQRIADDTSQAANRKVSIAVSTLQALSIKLLKLSEEIDALHEEKK